MPGFVDYTTFSHMLASHGSPWEDVHPAPEGAKRFYDPTRDDEAVDTLGERGRAAHHIFWPVGQSPYDLVPVNPCHVAQAKEAKPGWHTLFAPGKQDAIREEMHFISLLGAVPVDIAEQLLKLYRAAQTRTPPSSDIEKMAQRVVATNPDMCTPYKMVLPVNTPVPAQTIIPTPQHPFDAAKEAKVKLAKEAEAKKAAEAAKVKAERDEKVGNAISRAFR